mgnify:FL=1
MLYTVGEMATLLGIAASTLRYYDQEGLLPFVERSSGGVRVFTEQDYAPLAVICCLKKSGLSVREIRAFVTLAQQGDDSLRQRLELFRRRKAAVERQIADLQETLRVLEEKCRYYEAACRAGSEDAVRGSFPGKQQTGGE